MLYRDTTLPTRCCVTMWLALQHSAWLQSSQDRTKSHMTTFLDKMSLHKVNDYLGCVPLLFLNLRVSKLFDLWATKGSKLWQKGQTRSRWVECFGNPPHYKKEKHGIWIKKTCFHIDWQFIYRFNSEHFSAICTKGGWCLSWKNTNLEKC